MVISIRQYFVHIDVIFKLQLALTMLWANSADDELVVCFLFSLRNRIWHFMQINLHLFAWKVKSSFLGKHKKKICKCGLLSFLPSIVLSHIWNNGRLCVYSYMYAHVCVGLLVFLYLVCRKRECFILFIYFLFFFLLFCFPMVWP